MLKVITVCNDLQYAQPLIRSLVKHQWDYVAIEVPEWKGFGTKLIETYNYLKANPEVTEFIFCDAFDVVVLGNMDEFLMKKYIYFKRAKAIFSSEKGCWPDGSLQPLYPETKSLFKYLNSGLYYFDALFFKRIVEANPISYDMDDQLYFSKIFLTGDIINLDYFQTLFNSHSFIAEGEYTYLSDEKRIEIMGNRAVFVHSNGRTVDEKLNELLK